MGVTAARQKLQEEPHADLVPRGRKQRGASKYSDGPARGVSCLPRGLDGLTVVIVARAIP
jgi:hypothetical protein